MPIATASAGALTVQVRATLTDVVWDFGDGSPEFESGTGLGHAFPQESDVSHTYQTASSGSGYAVRTALRYAVEYSVNGGPWTNFGTKSTAFTASYQVGQAQPEAVGAR